MTSVAAPGMTPTTYTHDGRGATLTTNLPDGTSINYQWNAATVMSRYIDQDQQPTAVTVKDALGRPISRTYPDNSTEAFVYDGARLTGYTNRQGKTLAFDGQQAVGMIANEGVPSLRHPPSPLAPPRVAERQVFPNRAGRDSNTELRRCRPGDLPS